MIKALVRHAPTVLLLTLSIFVFGLVSYISLPREAAPDVKIPYVMVTTPYIGVSAEDIESLVTIPIENELSGVKDLKKMSSTSAEGASMIALEFEPDVVIEDALQRVRDRVNRAKTKLPEDTEDPQVKEISFADFPVMIVTIAGPIDEEQLKHAAEDAEELINRIPGVLDVTLSGGLTREIRVQVDPRRLQVYGLSLNDVIGAISNENVNIPGGDVRAGDASFLLRVPGEFTDAQQIGGVAVKRVGDRPVFVRDLGQVVDGFTDRESYARMNGEKAVSLSITKRAGANIVEIGDEVKRIMAEQHESWPEGVTYRVLSDRSKMVRNMVTELENNIITALILVVGVILIFMGARNSLFVALSIPLSMLISFAVIDALGMTLNMIVLFSLILALGMLVDNAIVIIENIYRHIELGEDVVTASVEGTREVAIAVAASTATTVAAFFPLVFWSGIMGQFMGFLPKTVIIVLLASLLAAVAILPVATSRLMRPANHEPRDVMDSGSRVLAAYRWMLEWSIRHRYVSAGIGGLSLIVTFLAYGFLNHGTEFFPATDPDRAIISVRAPDGTELEATDRIVRRIEGTLAQIENVDVYVAETGVGGGGNKMAGAQMQPNVARVTVDFLPNRNNAERGEKTRVESTVLTIDHIRDAVTRIPGAEIEVEKERMGPPVGAPVAVEVSGDDFHQVGELASVVLRKMQTIEGTADLSDNYRVGRPELRLRIDRGAAKRVGASTGAVANTIRTAVSGTKASALRDGKDEYDIMVEVDPRFREDIQDILGLRIPGREDRKPETFQVPLSTVASYTLAGGSGAIRHIDQKLVVTIEGDVAEGYNENDVRNKVVAMIDQMRASGQIPPRTDLRLGGANDEQRTAQAFLGRAFGAAIALILIVLVTQFNGFRLPAIIMATVILSLIGVLWGLILTGTPFGIIMTGIGVISLAGVVVNNAIVLLDYVEQLRKSGVETHEALVRAGMTRFRPVMLTAVTTVLGLVPMAVGISIDFRQFRVLFGGSSAQWWGPMAIAVIFGLSFATILTLVLVPTMYSIFEDLDRAWAWLRRRLSVRRVTAVGALLALPLLSPDAHAQVVTLEQAWTAAQQNDLDLALSAERTTQVETLRGQAWSLLSPKVSGQGSYTINEHEIAFDPNDMIPAEFQDLLGDTGSGDPIVIQQKEAWAGSASVVQPIFNGRAIPLLFGAYRTVDATRLDEETTRQQIRATVTRAYYGLAVARERQSLAGAALETARSSEELVSRQVQAGAQPERARLQARLSVAEAERAVRDAEAQVTVAQESFHRLTGLAREVELVMPEPASSPASVDEALAQALDHRPDLQAAEQRVKAARYSKVAGRMGWLPTVDGRFTYAYTENTGFSDDKTQWMAVLTANWNLWDGGLRIAQSREDASKLRQAELIERKQQMVAKESVRNAWQRLNTARSGLQAAQAQVELATQNLQLAQTALTAGSATWLEVDQAQLSLVQARLALLGERVSRDLAVVDLAVATGTY